MTNTTKFELSYLNARTNSRVVVGKFPSRLVAEARAACLGIEDMGMKIRETI